MNSVTISEYLSALDQHPNSTYLWYSHYGDQLELHSHHKGQLTYVEGGVIFLHTEDRSYFLPARHYAWIPAGVKHRFHHRYPSVKVRTIHFDPERTEDDFFKKMGIYPVSNLLLEMLLFSERWHGDLFPGSKAYDFLNTMKNILPLISLHPLPIALPTTDNMRLRPVLVYIHQHIADNLTLDVLGKEFGFSERTLSRLFKTILNMPFFQYLKLTRIIKAMEYLIKEDLSISEIAYRVGYNSISAFSNTFYSIMGQRPTEFQQLNGTIPEERI
ncbi:AraC family transcriptional regulator [Olivibacter sp. CPCC 100613]|uniref:helix-turn-helix domain-containing protein n=1 Tax=Olivibacter sp. CPCC 100613 TaxID=3079931 RepID=UPI002FF4AB82